LSKFIPILILFIFFLFNPPLSAQDKPPLPYESKGLCPFECCTYRKDWVVDQAIKVLTERKPGAPVAFALKKGDKVEGLTGVVITHAVVLAKGAPANPNYTDRKVKPGESLYLLSPIGEGCYLAWYRGKILDAACPDDIVEPTQFPKTEWWVKIKNSKGQTGWVKWPHEENLFSNVDACE
jgi:hypothetical protein